MSTSAQQSTLSVALIGNPNTGKSTLFGALVGVHQHVGNYPGVTVEKKAGRMDHAGQQYELIDLPGLYSLAPRSRDEMVAVDVLLGRGQDSGPVDAVVCIVDAGNLRRNLYLVSQALELGLPTVLAVNLIDVARNHGISIDVERLQRQLGVPVVEIQANRRIGLPQLRDTLAETLRGEVPPAKSPFPEPFEKEVADLQAITADLAASHGGPPMSPCLARRLLLDSSGYLEEVLFPRGNGAVRGWLEAARSRLAEAQCAVPAIETASRYDWASRVLEGVETGQDRYAATASDRIDRLLTHRWLGTLFFAALMVLVFQSVFVWAEPLMGWIDVATE